MISIEKNFITHYIIHMTNIKTLTTSALLAVIISISAYISIPLPSFTVSFTLQTLVIMIIGLGMPKETSITSVLLYLFLGAIGLPVFSHGQAGLVTLFGPTGGYLFGFLLATIFMSLFKTKTFLLRVVLAFIGGVVVVYIFGVIGLMWVLEINVFDAIMIGVIPFIVLDTVKAILAAWFVTKYQTIFNRFN